MSEDITAAAKLTIFEHIIRVVSVIICGLGASCCAYSLTLQVSDIGSITAALCWFAGLGAAVVALGGYVATCFAERNNHVKLVVIGVSVVGIASFLFERVYLYSFQVILLGVVCIVVQGVILILYHVFLKKRDPLAY